MYSSCTIFRHFHLIAKMRKEVLLITCLSCLIDVYGQVIINELMQSNVDCIMDDMNDFPDSWIELYNEGMTDISLQDYRIGKKKDWQSAWQLPDVKISSKGFVIIYCDKASQGLHTNFRLESGKGCEVWLFHDSKVVDQVTDLQKQPAPNIAYGRLNESGKEWGYQLEPTPGSNNCGATSDRILGFPIFSETGRVITGEQSLSLTLTMPNGTPEGAEIHYTTDGSEPTRFSTVYNLPITINSTTVVRACIFFDGWLSPRSVTQSYIFFSREMTLPLISITTDKRYLKDSKIGIYIDGNYESGKKNYEHNWRRPMNIEVFDNIDMPSVINQLCEGRVAGGATRGADLKSMVVYAHQRFGTKHFAYEFFPDQKPGIKEFKSIMLRNGGNDFDYLYMRDPIVQRSMATHVDLDWQAWQPAIIYINGEYKGMLNIRERSNEDYVWSNYNKLDDIDMIENWKELKEGSWDNYNELMDFCKQHGHTLAEFEQIVDCDEYSNLILMNLYFNNFDTPGNNWMMWRPRQEGGRWRFVAKDTDFTLGLYGASPDYKILEWFYNPDYDREHNWGANSSEATRLFRRLMEDEVFNQRFIDKAAIYMGDFLNEKGIRAVWDPMYELFKTEFTYHRRLYQYNQWWPRNYNEELRDARNWLSRRTDQFYQQLGDYYKLGSPIKLTINKRTERVEDIDITFNGHKLSNGMFDGKFFAGREVVLSGEAYGGRTGSGWNVLTISSKGAVNTQVNGANYKFVMPQCTSLTITPMMTDASAINHLGSNQWTWHLEGEQLILTQVPSGTVVHLYDLRGMLLYNIIADGSVINIRLTHNKLHILKVGTQVIKL